MFQLPFFHMAQYSVCGVRLARSAWLARSARLARSVRHVFRACATLNASSLNTIKHALRTTTPCAFGASSSFWWNFSVEKKFCLLLRCTHLHLRCTAPSILCAPPSFSLARHAPQKVSIHRGCYGLSEIRTFDPRIFVWKIKRIRGLRTDKKLFSPLA